MLDNYDSVQSTACKLLKDSIKNNCLSHAYLIDENGYSDSYNFVISFVKEILREDYIKLNKGPDIDNLFKRIDEGNYPEIEIVNPDGMLIKKQQILDLQKKFSLDPVEGIRRIYIIRDCDKMRSETANSMLKFLEEPVNNVIAILMTNNYNNILPTIISRCQIVKLNSVNTFNIDEEILNVAFNFVQAIEVEKINTLTLEKQIVFDNIQQKDREKMTMLFDYLIDIYYDIVKKYIGLSNFKYNKYIEIYNKICDINDYDKLLRKIDILLRYRDYIKCNVNVNLLFDSLIVSFGGM